MGVAEGDGSLWFLQSGDDTHVCAEKGQAAVPVLFLRQSAPPGSDATGANFSWAPAVPPVTARAKIEFLSALDTMAAGQNVSHVVMLVTIRWQEGILPNSRFTTEMGSTFIVQGIRNIEDRNVLLELTCTGLGGNE